MIVQGYYDNLPIEMETELAVKLAKLALPVWERYAHEENLIFTDNSAGLIHKIDSNVLQNTLKEIEDYITLSRDNDYSLDNSGLIKLYENFEELVFALEEGDWELPAEVECSFYCIYGVLKELICTKEVVPWNISLHVSVNRTLETLEGSGILSEQQIINMLEEIKNNQVD
jgi:hypothetical protein